MYLGVMGWIGSVLTIRGVQLVTQLRVSKPEVKPIAPTTLKTEIPKSSGIRKAEKPGKIRKVKAAK